MPWANARDFLHAELTAGETMPITYNVFYKAGPHKGKWKVIVLSPDRVETLTEIRKEAGIHESNLGGVETVNFAPTGVCQCCGR